jgi:hypothetical protein
MFTPSERDHIREWLAFARIFQDSDPQLDAAITAVQSQADGGTQPDNVTEVRVRGYLTQLAALDVAIDGELGCVGTVQVGNIHQDKARGVLMIERRQRVYVGRIADALSMKPYRDVTQAKESMPGGDYLANARTKGGWP